MSQQHILAVKTNCLLGCITKGGARDTIVLLPYLPERDSMEYGTQARALQDTTEADL